MVERERALVYEGSVKKLWEWGAADSGRLEFEYTDAYSVFDWGRMPDALARKGESLASLGAYFFTKAADAKTWAAVAGSRWLAPLPPDLRRAIDRELKTLAAEGLAHHFIERSAPNRLVVRRVQAVGPVERKFAGQTVQEYAGQGWSASRRLVPLEVVFRFGMPRGSSLADRLTPEYARQLGLAGAPREGQRFDRPVLEFFTKLEDTDRFLTWEQALNYAGLDWARFESLVARSFALALWLEGLFESAGLELWDGKLEWALIDGRLTLVDSIGPDELRLLDPSSGLQLSKEFLRLFYRPTPWFEAVTRAKKEAAADPALDWKELVLRRAGPPPALSPGTRAIADALYPTLARAIAGENPGGLGVALPELLERIRRWGA